MQKTTVQHPFARPKPIPPKPTVGWSPGPFDCVTSRTIQPNVARCRHGNIIWEGCDTSGHRGRRNLKVFLGHPLGWAPRPSGPGASGSGDTHIPVCQGTGPGDRGPVLGTLILPFAKPGPAFGSIRILGTLTFLLGQTMSVPSQSGSGIWGNSQSLLPNHGCTRLWIASPVMDSLVSGRTTGVPGYGLLGCPRLWIAHYGKNLVPRLDMQ
jgi:hypothetical protein